MKLLSYFRRVTMNRKLRYGVDRPYLGSARAAIEQISRVPHPAPFAGVLNRVLYTLVVLE